MDGQNDIKPFSRVLDNVDNRSGRPSDMNAAVDLTLFNGFTSPGFIKILSFSVIPVLPSIIRWRNGKPFISLFTADIKPFSRVLDNVDNRSGRPSDMNAAVDLTLFKIFSFLKRSLQK
jgi:hypothetical protein